jgi:hypothetical protein
LTYSYYCIRSIGGGTGGVKRQHEGSERAPDVGAMRKWCAYAPLPFADAGVPSAYACGIRRSDDARLVRTVRTSGQAPVG